MKFAILYSKKDLAGTNIAKQLKRFFLPQVPRIKLKKQTIYEENIDKRKELRDVDFIVFASKHESKKDTKTLSLHAPGNWRSASFGGKASKIAPTSALVLKYLFQKLQENTKKAKQNNNLDNNYEVTLEATHHGPYLEKPCCFIEIGSNQREWQDSEAAEVIAKTISSLNDYEKQIKEKSWQTALGIGGPHYCPNFNKVQLNSEYATGHIIPEYVFPLTLPMLNEALEKTKESIQEVLLDWKGCGKSKQRQEIIEIIKQAGLNYKRTSNIGK